MNKDISEYSFWVYQNLCNYGPGIFILTRSSVILMHTEVLELLLYSNYFKSKEYPWQGAG